MIDVLDELAEDTADAHTSIVLAYNVDLLVYDKLVRRRLASAGVSSQIVFCDATPYAASLDAIDPTSRVGRAYSVTPVRVEGAFHPKVYLLLGRRSGRLVLGSGNASIGGLVRNAEVFGTFTFDAENDSGPHPAFAQVFALAKRLAERAVPAVRSQLARAEQWTPWLTQAAVPDGRTVRLGGSGAPPLMNAVRERVRTAGARRIVAISSSFDRQLHAVRELARLGDGKHETVVVVQPDRVEIDGNAVGKLGEAVAWRRFVDPRPTKKKKAPRDSYLHAKVILVEAPKSDHLFFGSANLSRPALVDTANVELVVELPAEPAGTWSERLGLAVSLEDDVRDELLSRRCVDEDRSGLGLAHLVGVEWLPGGGWIVIASTVPEGARLALGALRGRAEQMLALGSRKDGAYVAKANAPPDAVRFAWLVDSSGAAASLPVALTWPDVARVRLGGWFGARVEQAILSMKDGELLGHVLFEFLDRVPDLGVLAATHGAGARGGSDAAAESDDQGERTEASFYTDATAASDDAARMAVGDRSDLDLLASLVQPLDAERKVEVDDEEEEEEEEDDEGIQEEAERRGLDRAKTDDGSERESSSRVPSAKRMRTAGRRFTRRIERAADALGATLGAIDDSFVLPPALIARQVWMTFIAAFVAGRQVETSDEGEQVVVEAAELAHYVMRCAAALAGDGSGGLLRRIEPAAWETREGKTLGEGLRFMISVCAWATAWFEIEYEVEPASGWTDDADDWTCWGIHDAIPLFVFARLLVVAATHAGEPDFADAARRVAAWDDLPLETIRRAYDRARKLAAWLSQADLDAPNAKGTGTVAPGDAVALKKAGIGIAIDVRDGMVRVAMLGRPKRPVVPFTAASARRVELPPAVGRVLLGPVPAELLGT
jgi:hypothetical protein